MHIIIDLLILFNYHPGYTVPSALWLPLCIWTGIFPDFSFLMTVGFRGLNFTISIPFFIMAGALMGSAI